MKRIRFTEEQIIAVLREHEAGAKTTDLARKHWHFGSHAVQLEGQIWRQPEISDAKRICDRWKRRTAS